MFSDPMVMFEENAGSTETRFTAIGISSIARTLYVVFVELEGDVTRIISARKATRHERKRYEEEG